MLSDLLGCIATCDDLGLGFVVFVSGASSVTDQGNKERPYSSYGTPVSFCVSLRFLSTHETVSSLSTWGTHPLRVEVFTCRLRSPHPL